ncbi:MAG TPA: hypothetical protein VJC17_02665, partial [Candidatus Dojkabacteria bacterium]|nr:hypothetical protein [Candidatus Dojkabacteria bacterium]
GNILHMPYSLGFLESFGFSALRPLSYGLMDISASLAIFDKVVFGVAGGFSFIFILVWLVKGKKNRDNLLFLGIIITIVLGYLLYKGPWMMYGPRFWLETLPFFILLTIAGIKTLINLSVDIFPVAGRHYLRQFMAIVIPAFFACVLLTGTLNWLSPVETEGFYPEFTPHTIGELKGFNFANGNLVKKVARMKISNAVVFIKHQFNWWNYGIPAFTADFSLEGDIVYAVDLGEEKNKKVMEMYPDRDYYSGDYDTAEVSRYKITE